MRAAGRRRPKDSLKPPATPTTNAASDPWQFTGGGRPGRDSDVSFASSRPSSSSIGINRSAAAAVPISDRAYQLSAIRTINAYLSSHSSQTSLKPPLPSAKDITETLRFVLARLEFPTNKLEEDLNIVLKHLNCPIKLNKSALRAPGTPHSWPSLLGVIHWLVQIARYNDYMTESSQEGSIFEDDTMSIYFKNSYLHYIQGDDEAVDGLDGEFMEKLQQERDSVEETVKLLGGNVEELEAKVERLKSEPLPRELLEKEKSLLEDDVKKFNSMIEQLNGHIGVVEKVLEEKEKELEVKVVENKKICEENDELKKRVELQGINSRDAERMKRELQAVERDIGEAETARNAWEEKSWDLDTKMGHKFKELEALLIECNQAIRRLKLGNGFQYELNSKGSTPAEVMGIDYKSTIKPALASFSEDIKKSSMSKLEEVISLQQRSAENGAKIEAKRNLIAKLQSHDDEVETHLYNLKKETQDYISRCATEAQKMAEVIDIEAHHMDTVEREATEFLKTSQLKLQEEVLKNEKEYKMCADELLALIDSVSKYKEYMVSKIAEMKSNLSETVNAVSDIYKSSLPAQFGNVTDKSN